MGMDPHTYELLAMLICCFVMFTYPFQGFDPQRENYENWLFNNYIYLMYPDAIKKHVARRTWVCSDVDKFSHLHGVSMALNLVWRR